MQLDLPSILKMVEMVLGVIVFGLHFVSEVGMRAIILMTGTGFCSPMVVQMFRMEGPFYNLTELEKLIDIFIIVYCMVAYLVASILTIVEVIGAHAITAMMKSGIAIVIVIVLVVDLIFISVLLAIMESKTILAEIDYGNVYFDLARTSSYSMMIVSCIMRFQASSFSDPIILETLLQIFFTSLGASVYFVAGFLGIMHWYKYKHLHAYFTTEEIIFMFIQNSMAFLLSLIFIFELIYIKFFK